MLLQYDLFDVKFSVTVRYLKKGFLSFKKTCIPCRCNTPPGGRHLCTHIKYTTCATLKEFRNNRAHFLYVFSSYFLFWIESDSSNQSDQFSAIVSRALSLTNECSCHFLQHHPQLSPPWIVHFLYICGPLPTSNILDTKVGQVKRGPERKKFIISWVPRMLKYTCTIFQSLNKGRLWWHNILGDNKGSISYILRLYTITARSVLLTTKLFEMKRDVRPQR